ncbi:MAG TPA: hypothetical protein PKN32_01325 [Bacteroidales bacterium]|nr:hypothetical protein [Bacteroidales bacterium]
MRSIIRKYILFIIYFALSFSFQAFTQNVGINTSTPDASALLELNSTTQGFLPPRLSTVERNAISSPAEGLIIYNTTEQCINYYNGTLWLSLCGSISETGVTIDTHPQSSSVCEFDNGSFSVVSAEGLSFQWQVNAGSGWQDITAPSTEPVFGGYNTAELTLTGVVASNDSWLFRCIVTGDNPPPATSNSATLTILHVPEQPSEISGPTEICPASETLLSTEAFDSDILVHGTSAPTTVWFAPDFNTPIAHSTIGGCSGGRVGYQGSWNNFWGNFLRVPQIDCTGHDEVSLNFDVSHSYFATHANDWCRFYMWADGGYKHNVVSVKINDSDVTYDSGINGKGFKFTEVRSCDEVEVSFDISAISDKSNILFYLEPSCGYNNSNLFSVWFDNIGFTTGSGANEFYYSITDEGYDYQWQVPADWTISAGQGTNSITINAGSIDGDVIVTPSNSCGNGPSRSLSVDVCP